MNERMLYRCTVCDMPMFEKIGPKIFTLQHYNGKPVKIEIERDMNVPYGKITFRCDACKKSAHILVNIHEVIGVQESYSIKTTG